MGRFEPSGVVRSFRSGSGEVTVWFPGGDVVAARVAGYVRGGIAAAAYAEVDRYSASALHPGRGFVDLSELTDWDWDARMVLVRWNLAHRHQASRLDLLTSSRVVHLAVRALGTILENRFVAHEGRVTFEAAYGAALPARSSIAPLGRPD